MDQQTNVRTKPLIELHVRNYRVEKWRSDDLSEKCEHTRNKAEYKATPVACEWAGAVGSKSQKSN